MESQTKFTPELAAEICRRLSDGPALGKICAELGIGRTTVYDWQEEHPEFAEQIARARVRQADSMAEKHDAIVEKTASGEMPPDVARVVLGGLQWQAKVLNPKRYGERISAELTGKDGGPLKVVRVSGEESEL